MSDEHKDRVFKFLFGNPENKHWTLSLYNAVNGSSYSDPEEIQFNTIEDAVYLEHIQSEYADAFLSLRSEVV